MDNYLMWFLLFVLGLSYIIYGILMISSLNLRKLRQKLKNYRTTQFLWRVECILRDFVLAYDDQEPERMLGVYHEADKLLKEMEHEGRIHHLDMLLTRGEK